MTLTLKRALETVNGIFSDLLLEDGTTFCETLEHAYPIAGNFMPKIPNGTYTCVRGWHRLSHMISSFETFEITGVEGHTNILFHVGNFNDDSEGCVLLGAAIQNGALTESRNTFLKFMTLLQGVDTFSLVVC